MSSRSRPLITEVTSSSPSSQPPKPAPRTFPVAPSSLLSRVQAFLPLIEQANRATELAHHHGQNVRIDESLCEVKEKPKSKPKQEIRYKIEQNNESESESESDSASASDNTSASDGGLVVDAGAGAGAGPTIEMDLHLGVLEEVKDTENEPAIKLMSKDAANEAASDDTGSGQVQSPKRLIEEL